MFIFQSKKKYSYLFFKNILAGGLKLKFKILLNNNNQYVYDGSDTL